MSAAFAKISACGIGDAATLMVSPFPGVMSNLPSSVVASVSVFCARFRYDVADGYWSVY